MPAGPTHRTPYWWPFFFTAIGALTVAEVMFLLTPPSWSATTPGRILVFWPVMLVVALAGARVFSRQSSRIAAEERGRAEALGHIEYLQAMNALLRTLASAEDLPRSLHRLATRIRAIVPCDRVGLALLTDDGHAFRTYTAHVDVPAGGERHARPDLHFARVGTFLDRVVSSREARIVERVDELAAEYLDANTLHKAGFVSALVVPLVFEDEVFGTLNLVSRRADAFSERDLQALVPVAEALATAYAARRLVTAAARHQIAHDMADLILFQVSEINGAVQGIIGRCDLMLQECPDAGAQRDAAMMRQESRRISEALGKLQRMTREDRSVDRSIG